MSLNNIPGFLSEPKSNPSGSVYTGRLVLDDVQVTGAGDNEDIVVTITVSVRQIYDAIIGRLLWTDQDVQRGILPEAVGKIDRELSLADGYPDEKKYVFKSQNADAMTEKLLYGEKLYINPLIWNLRPNKFEAFYDNVKRQIYLYDGKIYLPDSHHRHQAIYKAAKTYDESPEEYPKFNWEKQYKVELYFFKKEDEGNYFHDKNQLTSQTARSKAFDLTTLDDLSTLTKKVIEATPFLKGNVNRITDTLSKKNPQLVTLSTLRQSIKSATSEEQINSTQMDGLTTIISTFYILFGKVRTEFYPAEIDKRNYIRENLLVAAPVFFQSYGDLISDFELEASERGLSVAENLWTEKLSKIGSDVKYTEGNWTGDVFDFNNPLWLRLGVLKHGVSKRLNLTNNRSAKSQVTRALRAIIGNKTGELNLQKLVP